MCIRDRFRQLRETKENVAAYAELTLSFLNRLNEKKRKKNILDFADQEHLALQILTREKDGCLVPSETADIFADYFEEIMAVSYTHLDVYKRQEPGFHRRWSRHHRVQIVESAVP